MDESFETQDWINTWRQRMFKTHREFLLGQMAEIPLDVESWQQPMFEPRREHSLGQVAKIPLDVEVRVDASDEQLATPEGRWDAVYSMEWAIHLFATGLNHAFAEAQTVVTEANVRWPEGRELFPWLSWPDRNVQVQLELGHLANALDMNRPLTEQKVEIVEERASITLQSAFWLPVTSKQTTRLGAYALHENRAVSPLFTLKLASLAVESATFEHGSLKARLKAALEILVVALGLVGPLLGAGAPWFKHLQDEHQFRQRIETLVAGQPCTQYANWIYDAKTMRDHSLEAFNFAASGLSDIERRERTCNAQLAMKMEQGSPNKIDGIPRKETEGALERFAKQHGLPPDTAIQNEQLRGAMWQVFWNRELK
jgi:hypothetical protein